MGLLKMFVKSAKWLFWIQCVVVAVTAGLEFAKVITPAISQQVINILFGPTALTGLVAQTPTKVQEIHNAK